MLVGSMLQSASLLNLRVRFETGKTDRVKTFYFLRSNRTQRRSILFSLFDCVLLPCCHMLFTYVFSLHCVQGTVMLPHTTSAQLRSILNELLLINQTKLSTLKWTSIGR